MGSRLDFVGPVLAVSALIFSGCRPIIAQPTEVVVPIPEEPVVEALTPVPPTAPTAAVGAADVQAARDAALAHLIEHYTEQARAPGLSWTEEFTPERPFHLPNYRYIAEDWVVTISYQTRPVVYQVVATSRATGFRWEGTVDARGQVTEQLASDDTRAVRDLALAYVIEHYSEHGPALGLAWAESRSTPEVWSGAGIYRYTAEDWAVQVYYPMMPSEAVVYLVMVANRAAGFQWVGQIDATGHVTEVLDDVLTARDAAVAYLSERYGEQAPAPGLTWTEDFVGVPVPEGPWGAGTFQYTCIAGDWAVIVSYQFLDPQPVVYRVVVANQAAQFHWEGEVDAAGQVTEKTAHIGG